MLRKRRSQTKVCILISSFVLFVSGHNIGFPVRSRFTSSFNTHFTERKHRGENPDADYLFVILIVEPAVNPLFRPRVTLQWKFFKAAGFVKHRMRCVYVFGNPFDNGSGVKRDIMIGCMRIRVSFR